MSGFFMLLNQLVSFQTRNTNILIPINFHLLFNNLGLTLVNARLKLRFIHSNYRTGPHHERRHYSHPASQ